MLNIYKTIDGKITRLDAVEDGCWVNLVYPSEDELKTVSATLGVEPGIVKNLARWLTDELGVEKVYTGHCTGAPAFALLQAQRPERIHPLRTGDVLDFPD